MQKYFYKANPYIKKFLFSQLQMVAVEEQAFRAAILAGFNNSPNIDQNELYENIMNLTLGEHEQYAQANHLEQVFKHFNTLHRYERNMSLVRNEAATTMKDLVDSDKFPIFDLSYKIPLWRSNWVTVENKLKKKVGFLLRVRESSLMHKDAGKGVFLETANPQQVIEMGTLLGFVPGSLYDCDKTQNVYNNRTNTRTEYLHFTKNKILDLSKIDVGLGLEEKMQGSFKNPYALGEYVNHPGPRQEANVIFQQISIPKEFFIQELLKFMPYDFAYGMFNTLPIKDGSELFVNYLDHHIYPLDCVPEWLLQPPPLSPVLQKNQYESVLPQVWSVLQKKALEYNREIYQKFKHRVKYEPSRVMYEHDKKQYRELVRIKYDKHL